MSKKIVITGSAGFIGMHLVKWILDKTDWQVIGIDSFRHRGDSERIMNLGDGRYEIICHDLNSPISQRTVDRIGDVDYIVNMASESHVDRSITDPVPFVQNNVNLALNVLEYARIVKPETFVQISTDEVYGPCYAEGGHTEWSTILPSNPYSASKAAQEAIAISYWRTYGVPLIITNTMNNFGEYQDAEKFIPMICRKVMAAEEVTIHGSEEYIGRRFYLYAKNHADALLFLLLNHKPKVYMDAMVGQCPSRFHIAGDQEIDNLELARMVAKILKMDLKHKLVDFHSARPGHDRRYALDSSHIRNSGWAPPFDLQASLERTVSWYARNLAWL